MGIYYSTDLRERALKAYLGGQSCREVAKRFDIAPSTVVKWAKLYKATGGLEHGKVGGHRAPVLEPHLDWITARLQQTSHLTLHKLAAELTARGVKVKHDAVWRFLRANGLSFKKKRRCSQPNKRAPTWCEAENAGVHCSPGWIRSGWSSSMRPGSKPTWRPCAAGVRAAKG
jgi:transposase